MLRRTLRFAGVALAVIALASCEFSIGPLPFDPAIEGTFTARVETTPTPLRNNVSIAPSDTLYFRIDLPAGVRDLLYGEVVGSGLRVGWLRTSGSLLAVSESKGYFAGSVGELGTGAAVDTLDAVAPRSIGVPFLCLGPCVAIAPTASGHYYLAVHNRSGVTRTFSVYAYTMWADDPADRGANANDTPATATPFGPSDVLIGAIELLGDRDWFVYTGAGNRILTFTVAEGSESVGLRLRFQDGTVLTGLPGQTAAVVRQGDRFEVYSALNRAGPAGSARYIIDTE